MEMRDKGEKGTGRARGDEGVAGGKAEGLERDRITGFQSRTQGGKEHSGLRTLAKLKRINTLNSTLYVAAGRCA